MKDLLKFKWMSVVVLAATMLVGCGDDKTEGKSSTDTQKVEETTGYTVVDDRGEEITFEQAPETVISLQPSNTEILYALGAGDKLVGVTDYDNYPEEALNVERVSDTVKFNSERIVELNPDVVIAYTIGDEAAITALEDLGVKVFVIASATSFDEVYGDITQIAQVMGIDDKGTVLNEKIQAQIADVQEKVVNLEATKNVYLEVSPTPDVYTTGAATFQQEILEAANVTNIFDDQEGWVKVADEQVITKNPDVILTTVYYTEDPVSEILGRQGWETISAIQNKEVYQIDGDAATRPGPRIGEAVEQVAKIVYPELFE